MAKTIQEALFEKGLVNQTQFLNSQNEKLMKDVSHFNVIEETGGKADKQENKQSRREPPRSIYGNKV